MARPASPRRIYLFGSRARGTSHRRSDVDLAFELDNSASVAWARFTVDAEDYLPTLLELDLVNLSTASAHIKNAISQEGIIIYERDETP